MKSRNLIGAIIVMVLGAAALAAFGAEVHPGMALGALCIGSIGNLQDVLAAVEDSNKATEKFMATINGRINDLETMEAKGNRPRFGGGHASYDGPEAEEHKAAFRRFITRGETNGLRELQEKSLNTGAGDAGGYAVPKVIDGMIEALAVNISPIRGISTVVQTSTQDFHKLVNLRGTASGWVGESAARPETTAPKLADITPPMGEVYSNISASQTMLDDAFFNADQWISENAATEFARAEGAAFINGTGVNQPMGFLSYPTAATADATRTFGTLEYMATGASGAFKTLSASVNPSDDFFTLVAKLKREYRPGACWVMNKNTLFAIMGMKDYQGRYVYNPATAPGMQDTLLGFPIVEAEDMPDYTSANAYAIAFGNFQRGYIVVDRIGTRVLRDPFSSKPNVMFYITKRLGGALQNSEAIKLLKFGTS